ncbi:hypothetical protein [Erythrobacter donghaensis]|uniref:hypothetical protein n=1 Tax=Erythrobacter donghaensis TaxID=267135 RepID=UPI001180008F|nr:hypothetical protein [Erythrobacter donghaensis]
MKQWEWEQEQGRREEETFRRIHLLREAGYVVAWSREVKDALFLDHLASGPDLILYPSGMIVSLGKDAPLHPDGGEDGDRILNRATQDVDAFDQWIRTISKPTWWQRGAPDREKYIYRPGCLLMFVLISVALGQVIQYIYNALMR